MDERGATERALRNVMHAARLALRRQAPQEPDLEKPAQEGRPHANIEI